MLITLSLNAQTIKLDFEPKGKIVKVTFDSVIVYTDTSSLFYVNDKHGDLSLYKLQIKNFILQQLNKSDTATITGPTVTALNNKLNGEIYVNYAIVYLTKEKKVRIFDRHGQLVKNILARKIASSRKGGVYSMSNKKAYFNKATKEELFREKIYYTDGCTSRRYY